MAWATEVPRSPMSFYQSSSPLTPLGDRLLQRVWDRFPTLQRDQLALTWLVYPLGNSYPWAEDNPETLMTVQPWGYDYRGDVSIYPASIVKMFYLVMLYESLHTGRLKASSEIDRASRDMIVDSSNDATGFILDVLTDTTSGPDLPKAEFERWQVQRNRINRYFHALGWPELRSVNLNQKTWCDGPYGRERSFLGNDFSNRNRLNTAGTARLFHQLINQGWFSPQACKEMMALLKRSLDPTDLAADPENQVTGFLGGGIPQRAKIWSKAGLMSRVRHDAIYVELDPYPPFVLVVFTEGTAHSQNERILPFIAEQTIAALAFGEGLVNL